MFEENLAKLRTNHKNIQRYRQLLETGLTNFEREYIDKRLAEEQSAIETLSLQWHHRRHHPQIRERRSCTFESTTT